MGWHLNPLCVDSAPDEDPRGERVRVPHLTRAEFIAAPHDSRGVWNQSEHKPRDICVLGNALWALDRFVDVRDDAVTPAPHLVAEEPNSASGTASDGAFGDDAARFAVLLDGSLFDYESALGYMDDERRVVEVTSATVREPCGYRLEELSVHANGVAPGAERQPVEVDRTLGLVTHRGPRLVVWHSRSFE